MCGVVRPLHQMGAEIQEVSNQSLGEGLATTGPAEDVALPDVHDDEIVAAQVFSPPQLVSQTGDGAAWYHESVNLKIQ